jgi:hypothetical protein
MQRYSVFLTPARFSADSYPQLFNKVEHRLEGVREGARGGAVFLVFVGELCILAGSKNNDLKEIT